MDSVTQIVLGAAVGEVVLGRKAGNRAMLWGAVAGTIPDLDVLANFVTDEMSALAFHRGLTHSLFFAILAPFAFAALVNPIYQKGWYQQKAYRKVGALWWGGVALVFMALFNFVPVMAKGSISFTMLGLTIGLMGLLGWNLWKNYYQTEPEPVTANYWGWVNLFFWATVTHPLLDCCTAFGTQFFQPFSDYRVAFNNVSVADPLYTLPFLICLIWASWKTRNNRWRRIINWTGIVLSSCYLLFGAYHKITFDRLIEKTLAEREIAYNRFTSNPVILNNFLWNVVVDADSAYYHSVFSFNDRPRAIGEFRVFPKNHQLVEKYEGERAFETLKWFSNNYYSIMELPDSTLQFNDMRFGTFGSTAAVDDPSQYIFKFILEEKNGVLMAYQPREEEERDVGKAFSELWEGIKGRKVQLGPGFKEGLNRINE